MVEPTGARRVILADVRGPDAVLRVTYHDAERLFVVSTWEGDRCTAAIRLPVDDAPGLISLLAESLAAAAREPAPVRPLRSA